MKDNILKFKNGSQVNLGAYRKKTNEDWKAEMDYYRANIFPFRLEKQSLKQRIINWIYRVLWERKEK